MTSATFHLLFLVVSSSCIICYGSSSAPSKSPSSTSKDSPPPDYGGPFSPSMSPSDSCQIDWPYFDFCLSAGYSLFSCIICLGSPYPSHESPSPMSNDYVPPSSGGYYGPVMAPSSDNGCEIDWSYYERCVSIGFSPSFCYLCIHSPLPPNGSPSPMMNDASPPAYGGLPLSPDDDCQIDWTYYTQCISLGYSSSFCIVCNRSTPPSTMFFPPTESPSSSPSA